MKTRLDRLLVNRALVASRERAQAMIIAGKVLVNGQKISKSGTAVDESSELRLLGEDLKYVSRGGLKLEHALQHWKIDVTGKNCLDVGTSTGGFTDCLLQHGAATVTGVDTGYGQIDFGLRQDSRVTLLEETNARYLTANQIQHAVDVVVMDVSFISATLVLPAVIAAAFASRRELSEKLQLIVLVKPQFEVGREHVGKGGIVREESLQLAAVEKVKAAAISLGAEAPDFVDSPILGTEGNREFLLHAVFNQT